MLDPKLEDDLMKEIAKDLNLVRYRLEWWVFDSIKAKISLVITRVYQEGMREAFLAMGRVQKSKEVEKIPR